ncbi:MAG: GntG family PLP-dependent aldolase [Armatimonadota bacterium]
MPDSSAPAEPVDLRSDTVTKPTPAMRRAMAEAEVGDDVFGEDPTINRLQEESARRLGFEAALYVPSGSMANQASIYTHTQPGDEVILEASSHVLAYEVGALASVSGVLACPLPGVRGAMDPETVAERIRAGSLHQPPTALICLENTHNNASGAVLPREHIAAIVELAHDRGVPVHIDGARIFNAAVALDMDPAELVAGADSVSFCFSKGLCAPVGSVICASHDFIDRARRARKMLGGGMRQAGVIAAAALVALHEMVDRLAEDHENARLLAEALVDMPGIRLDMDSIQTNIVIFEVARDDLDAETLVARLKERGVLCLPRGPRDIRFVTHHDVSREGVLFAIQAVREILGPP